MAIVLKTILEIPIKLGLFLDRVNNEIDAHQVFLRQPEHCTVVRATLVSWSQEISEEELSDPETKLKESDLTQRFQTVWSTFDNLQQLKCSSSLELLNRLNLAEIPSEEWLLLIVFRTGGKELYCLCVSSQSKQIIFPPYQPGKRVIRSPNCIRSIQVYVPNSEQPIDVRSLQSIAQLLGPKYDFFKTTSTPAPQWLITRFIRRKYPNLKKIEYV